MTTRRASGTSLPLRRRALSAFAMRNPAPVADGQTFLPCTTSSRGVHVHTFIPFLRKVFLIHSDGSFRSFHSSRGTEKEDQQRQQHSCQGLTSFGLSSSSFPK